MHSLNDPDETDRLIREKNVAVVIDLFIRVAGQMALVFGVWVLVIGAIKIAIRNGW